MKIIIKELRGGTLSLEVLPTTYIYEIKRLVAVNLGIPTYDQKLLLLGRTLSDEMTVQSYPAIKDGTKLNLIIKKRESLFDVALSEYRRRGMADNDALSTAHKLMVTVKNKFRKLSWDDIDRLCLDCLQEENGHDCEHETEAGDMSSV